jgi:hypothetical protein
MPTSLRDHQVSTPACQVRQRRSSMRIALPNSHQTPSVITPTACQKNTDQMVR